MFTIKLFFVSKRYDSLCLFYSKSDNYPIRLFSCETLYRYSRETKKKKYICTRCIHFNVCYIITRDHEVLPVCTTRGRIRM